MTPGVLASHPLARNSFLLAATQIIKFFVRGLYVLILARELGALDYGLYGYGHHWYLVFFTLSSLGISQATLVSMGRSDTDRQGAINTSLGLRLALLGLGWLASIVYIAMFETADAGVTVLAVFSLAVIFRGLAAWASIVCVGLLQVRPVMLVETLWRAMELLIGLVLVRQGTDVVTLAWLHVGSYALESAHLLLVARRGAGGLMPDFNPARMNGMLRMALPAGIGMLAYSWLYTGPVIIARNLLGLSDQLGIIALLLTCLSMLAVAPHATNNVLLPRLSCTDASEAVRREQYLRLYTRYGVTGGIVLAGLISALDQWLWPVLLGDGYAGLAALTSVGVWFLPCLVIGLAWQQLMHARGLFLRNALVLVVVSLFETGLLLVLVPESGVTGLVWAVLGAFILWALLSQSLVRRWVRGGDPV